MIMSRAPRKVKVDLIRHLLVRLNISFTADGPAPEMTARHAESEQIRPFDRGSQQRQ
jgi:hypothetical protein